MSARAQIAILGWAISALVVLSSVSVARAEGPTAEAAQAVPDAAAASEPAPAPVAAAPAHAQPVATPFALTHQAEVVVVVDDPALPHSAPDALAPRGGLFLRGRAGPSLGPDPLAFGGAVTAFVGYESAQGLGFGVSAGARWVRGDGYSVLDFCAAAIFRVSALPDNRFHPFGELGIALHLPNEASGGQTELGAVVGGDFALGLEVDITPSFSLEFAGRGEVLVRQLDSYSVYLTPFMGFVAHL